jgi:hypothetical protein
MREFLKKFMNMDRRYVFLGVGVFTVVPLLMGWGLPVIVREEVQTVFDEVEKVQPDGKPMILSFDFDPSTQAELLPMAEAILRHVFHNGGKVICSTFMPTGAALAEDTLFRIANERGAVYGEDYIFLGYSFPPAANILAIGEDIRITYPTDYQQTPLDNLPMMRDVKNYRDIQLVVDLAGNSMPVSWIANAWGRYGANVTMGITAVMAPDYKPYVMAGQSQGMLGGMRGAAEYEKLLLERKIIERRGQGMLGMDSQSAVHLFMVVIIILGNLAYFLTRKR